jgi:hypothetical protein
VFALCTSKACKVSTSGFFRLHAGLLRRFPGAFGGGGVTLWGRGFESFVASLSALSAAIDLAASIAAALPAAFGACIAFLLPAFALLRAAIAPV